MTKITAQTQRDFIIICVCEFGVNPLKRSTPPNPKGCEVGERGGRYSQN